MYSLYKNNYNNFLHYIHKVYQIKKLFLYIFFLFFATSSHISASWVIINDDGTTDIYIQKETKPYKIKEDKKKPTINITKNLKSKSSKKVIYLTFDDGPLLGSNNIITVLQEENVEATMFMVGKHIQKSKSRKKIFQRALNEPLILVANHTYSHANGRYKHFYSNSERVLLDIQHMDDILFENDPKYLMAYCRLAGRNVFRLPSIKRDDYGIKNESEAYNALWDAGYHIYGWDYQWSYNPKNGEIYKSPYELAQVIERIHKKGKTRTKGKFILLMHDFSFRDKFDGKEILRTLIQELKYLGWKFKTLTSY